jgi:hypothetical protein
MPYERLVVLHPDVLGLVDIEWRQTEHSNSAVRIGRKVTDGTLGDTLV